MHTLPRSAVNAKVVPEPLRRIDPHVAAAVAPKLELLETEQLWLGFFVVGSIRLAATVKFVPANLSAVTEGVTRVSSVHEAVFDPFVVPLDDPPPRPVIETTGFVTGCENDTVNVPRLVHSTP